MRSLPPQSYLTQVLDDGVNDGGAMSFGWITNRRVEGKGVVTFGCVGDTAERGHSAIGGVRLLLGVPDAGAE